MDYERQGAVDDTQYDFSTQTLIFYLLVDGEMKVASVSRECLEDHCGMASNSGAAADTAFRQHAGRLREIAEAKIRAGQDAAVSTFDW